MGKVRVNVIGGEEEAQQKLEAEKRREAKKMAKEVEKTQNVESVGQESSKELTPAEATGESKKKKMVKKQTKAKQRSARYTASISSREKNKVYGIKEALSALEKMSKTKFDETVELHINTNDKITGNIVLPHGTGKKTKVAIFAPSKDPKAAQALLASIESGKIDFDVLVATPDSMASLAKVARILGPKGLMPNPKTGTVTRDPEEVAKKYEGGQVNYKTEAKANVMHVSVGKMSFGTEKLTANIGAFLAAMDNSKIRSVFLKSTMSPSIKLK
jgi:large subunit ribosomal protein L1